MGSGLYIYSNFNTIASRINVKVEVKEWIYHSVPIEQDPSTFLELFNTNLAIINSRNLLNKSSNIDNPITPWNDFFHNPIKTISNVEVQTDIVYSSTTGVQTDIFDSSKQLIISNLETQIQIQNDIILSNDAFIEELKKLITDYNSRLEFFESSEVIVKTKSEVSEFVSLFQSTLNSRIKEINDLTNALQVSNNVINKQEEWIRSFYNTNIANRIEIDNLINISRIWIIL